MTAETRPTGLIRPGRRVRPQLDDKPEVVRLARLLVRAAPLAELVNADAFSDEDRARLRDLAGWEFVVLFGTLAELTGVRARPARRAQGRRSGSRP